MIKLLTLLFLLFSPPTYNYALLPSLLQLLPLAPPPHYNYSVLGSLLYNYSLQHPSSTTITATPLSNDYSLITPLNSYSQGTKT